MQKNREQSELLSSVRDEIDAYKSRNGYTASSPTMDQSHRNADTILDMAHGVHTGLITQKSALQSTYQRLQDVAERFPAVNQLMMKVRVRRRRDQMILGLVLAICMFLFFI